jgi:hypothetical protein
VTSQYATPTAGGAAIQAGVQAARIYLVMTSAGNLPRTVRVLVDGRPSRAVTVKPQQLYTLVSLPRAEFHTLTVDVPPGVQVYDFTFG